MMATKRGAGRARVAMIVAAYPRRAAAAKAARALVRAGALACATVAAGGTAFYRWNGKFEESSSVLLWGKTTATRARAAVKAIAASHPDQVPEILVLPCSDAHPAYAAWVAASTKGAR
ncbi:MAG TPA: divalent cation tolerance protein CutA [Candidatus Eisenbacteria bacterium]|nr:divalent cation tolerance protein CutA [Candidatus Eisenbacteria bacterium]